MPQKELTDADYLKMNISDIPAYGYDIHYQKWLDARSRAGNESTGRLANPVEADGITQEMVDEASAKGTQEEVAAEVVSEVFDIGTLTVSDAETHIAAVGSKDELAVLRKQEKKGKDRVGVISAIDARKAELDAQ